MEVTQEDLAGLPLRAIVCFAARAARRVFPLYGGWHTADVRAAIEAADGYAAAANAANAADALDAAVNAAANAVNAANAAAAYADEKEGYAAAEAARATADAAKAAAAEAVTAAAKEAGKAALHAAYAYANVANDSSVTHDSNAVYAAAYLDYEAIKALVLHIGEGPWDPSESGPLGRLWPLGAPDWWPEKNMCKGKALEVTFSVPADATTEEVAAIASDVVVTLNRHNISRDGAGLLVAPDVEVKEPVRQEVPSG